MRRKNLVRGDFTHPAAHRANCVPGIYGKRNASRPAEIKHLGVNDDRGGECPECQEIDAGSRPDASLRHGRIILKQCRVCDLSCERPLRTSESRARAVPLA